MQRLGRLLVLLAGAILLGIAPAVAIETTTFGIDVVDGAKDGRLHIDIKAGETTRGELRVWNKTQDPKRLRLSVVAASVDDSGAAKLGGDDEPVKWVSIEPADVRLAPGGDATVKVAVAAPRKLDGDTKTVAVVAEPAPVDGVTPPVIERLAVTTFLEPDQDSLIASLGPFPWIAAVVLLAVVVALVLRSRRKEPTGNTA